MESKNNKLLNYRNALVKLQQGIDKYDESDDLQRDGLIQRFEFTFELAWKALKNIFEDEGLTGLNSPKTVLREAFAAALISNDEIWLEMLRDRNNTAHIYSEKMAVEICRSIREKYLPAMQQLSEQLERRQGVKP